MDIKFKKILKKQICKINSAEGIFELFKTLKYPEEKMFDVTYKQEVDYFKFKKEDSERINKIYSVLNFDENLPVFLLETTSLAPSFIRSVATKFDSQYLRFLIILVDKEYSEIIFVLPDREKVEEGKYRLKITKLVINKEDIKERSEYYTVIDTLSKIMYENESNWREVWRKWRESFNVEKVTEAFFEDYKNTFFKLRKSIQSYLVSPKDAHEYTLQFLNRIMFIYFISKKGWLKYPKFMYWFWRYYKEQNKFGSNEFHGKWLNQVFFKGFNNRGYEVKDLPQDIKDVIISFPYLNGGLFKENNVDTCPVKIKDEMFQKIFEFFEKYNFTIKEDMPFESEVAVDPQMIGYVYETLASLSSKDVDIYTENEKKEDAESRKKWGIFYTPIVEVDFMCRRSLVEYLANHLPDLPKDHIYHFVFDAPGELDGTENYLIQEEWWDQIEDTLDNLSIVDPACGSGAFLVGMMNVIGELYGKVYKHTDTNLDDYQMKYRIIQRSLYGVDVMKWAVHAAELRLWLQLIIETNIKGEELRKSPLLPNLNLNLRVGDSLVQEIGGMSFNVKSNDIDKSLKKKLEELKHEKAQYFENPQRAKYKSIEAFHKQELKLFNSIIDSRIKILQNEIESKDSRSKSKQVTLGAKTTTKVKKFNDKLNKKILAEIKEDKIQIQNLMKMKKALKESEKKPFVWEIDFAEIFGDKNGFDVVIGNPPYLRHQKISPPNKIKLEVSEKDQIEYKDKLVKSVKEMFPMVDKLDRKNDYYIYFYFHGLNLLNDNGVFCFITSNSWLDLDYGKNLQEYLLRNVYIHAIYDNRQKRSFKHADVNTVIVIFSAPLFKDERSVPALKKSELTEFRIIDNESKFIMFKKPFEESITTQNMIEIENIDVKLNSSKITELIKNLVDKNDYRAFPINQLNLLENSWEYPKNYDLKKGKFSRGHYKNGNWGIKYLKAPKIFYRILSKGAGKLDELKEFVNIETYLNTGGADDFFFFKGKRTDKGFKIVKDDKLFILENEFVKKLISTPRILNNVKITDENLNEYLLAIPSTTKKSDLKKTNVWEYIKWGESEGFNKKSGRKNKKEWWILPNQAYAGNSIIIPCRINERHAIFWNPSFLISHRYYRIKPNDNVDETSLLLALNSTLTYLSLELFRNPNLGGGVLDLTKPLIEKIILINPSLLKSYKKTDFLNRKISSIFVECGLDPLRPFREQDPKPLTDRAELDNIIFNELELTEEERKEVYWGVCELAKQRLDKSKSKR